MKPGGKRTDEELLEWAMSIVAREQQNGTYGVVSVHMEKGRVTRVLLQRSEKPEDDD